MSKQIIINQIVAEFNRLGIKYQADGTADCVITTEFLDAGWSTGSKKISYEASIFVDETSEIVFMYELTKESGNGLSFGSESGSYSQNGTTLFRKVKSVQYGADGKAYEYTLNLGDIPKAVKEAAKKNGWKFKTVLRKEKASYPIGYIPVSAPSTQQAPSVQANSCNYCVNCGTGLAEDVKFCPKCGLSTGTSAVQRPDNSYVAQDFTKQTYEKPETEKQTKKKEKAGMKAGVLLCISAVLVLTFYSLMSIPIIDWVLTIVVLAGFFLLARKVAAKSFMLTLCLWVISMIVIFFIFAFAISGKNSNTIKINSDSAVTTSSTASTSQEISTSPQVNMNDLFSHIIKEVKQDWKRDAKISKIYTIKPSNDFHEIKSFNPAFNWNVTFYSPSSNTEIYVILRYEYKDSEGFPEIGYFCQNKSGEEKELRQLFLKQNPDYYIKETTIAAAYREEYAKMPDNMLLGATMTAEQIGDKMYEHVKDMANSSGSYGISIYYEDQMITNGDAVNSALWEISWESNGKRIHYVINPFNRKTYEY